MMKAILFALALLAVPLPAKADPPNVIFILADDLGFGDPKTYQAASKIPTPNLDDLAAEGTKFVRTYAPASLCSPTRYDMQVGTHAWRTRPGDAALTKDVVMLGEPSVIDPNKLTIAKMLKAQGYYTGFVGKWHLGATYPTTDGLPFHDGGVNIDFSQPVMDGPIDRGGYDYAYWVHVPAWPPLVWYEDGLPTHVPDALAPANIWRSDIIPQGPYWTGYKHEDLHPTTEQKSLEFIEDHAHEPFLLFVSLPSPHTPVAPSTGGLPTNPADPFDVPPQNAGPYGTMVQEIDRTVGRIVAKLDQEGILENTIIVFTSDNGGDTQDGRGYQGARDSLLNVWNHDQNYFWRSEKASIYQGGFVVPHIVRWDGHVAAGAISIAPLTLTDWPRTLARIAGYTVPSGQMEDSFDMLPQLTGDPVINPTRPNGDIVLHSKNGSKALVRQNAWKVMNTSGMGWEWPKLGGSQLYNIGSDPSETTNLSASNPGTRDLLLNALSGYIANPMHP